MRNNLTGGFLMAREAYTQSMKQHGGAIVNIIADMCNGMPTMGHSGAARAGMLNFTETAPSSGRRRARQHGLAGLDRIVGLDTYPKASSSAYPRVARSTCRCVASAPRARSPPRSCFLFCAGGRLHHRRLACASTAACP